MIKKHDEAFQARRNQICDEKPEWGILLCKVFWHSAIFGFTFNNLFQYISDKQV